MRFIALLCLITFPAAAELSIVPKWKMSGGQACYSLEDAKTLVLLDARLVACQDYDSVFGEMLKATGEGQDALKLKSDALELSLKEAASLKTQMDTCITERAQAQAEAASGPGLGWLVAGGLALTLLGFLLGNQVIK